MSNDIETPNELDALKARADVLGIKYRSDTTVDTLRAKVAAKLAEPVNNGEDEVADKPVNTKAQAIVDARREHQLAGEQEAARLVRIKLTNHNPAKREWEGEVFSVGNEFGTHVKYVPFNADEGWYVPNIIYQYLAERKCQVFYTVTDERGQKTRKGKLINEFSIEVLPNHTPEELEELAASQAARKAID